MRSSPRTRPVPVRCMADNHMYASGRLSTTSALPETYPSPQLAALIEVLLCDAGSYR